MIGSSHKIVLLKYGGKTSQREKKSIWRSFGEGGLCRPAGGALSSAADGDVIIQISLPPKLTAMCKMNQSSPHSPAKSATCKCHA